MALSHLESINRDTGVNGFHHAPPQENAEPIASAAETNIKHVVIAVRTNNGERDAVTQALQMAAAYRARVTLLHVAEPPQERSFHWLDAIDRLYGALSNPVRNSASAIEKARSDLAAFLKREIPGELRAGMDIRCECRVGDVATEVARFAEEQAGDLVLLCNCPSTSRLSFLPGLTRRIAALLPKGVVLAHLRR